MNRINPLHIIILSIVFFVFLTFKLNHAKDELNEVKKSLQTTSKLAVKVDSFKKSYNDKNKIIKEINSILRHHILKSTSIKKEIKNSKITLTSDSINKSALNYLMGKLLNKSFNITKLSIKKVNDVKANLKVEIKW